MNTACALATQIEQRLLCRNPVFAAFFARESLRLAETCREMSNRFLRGGRLLAFGQGAYATDAQHVSVEFVHPVIVGKRALPALDLSLQFRPWLKALVNADDIVMGFGPPRGDVEVHEALDLAERGGAMTLALPGTKGTYFTATTDSDPFIHQEMIEVLYHTLWETVHVFFEHRELGHDVGDAGFLYPFLGKEKQATDDIVTEVASSIEMKAQEDARLRQQVAKEESEKIGNTVGAIRQRIEHGGKLILFGNGGSATDANDFALDCVAPPDGLVPIPAISLSMEAASISAIANDVGHELIFLRQLIAQARPNDVVMGFSTSGGSRNIVLALEEARKRNLLTVALLGYDGGEVVRRDLADYPLVVHCDYIPRIQEVQASIYHVMREALGVRSHGRA